MFNLSHPISRTRRTLPGRGRTTHQPFWHLHGLSPCFHNSNPPIGSRDTFPSSRQLRMSLSVLKRSTHFSGKRRGIQRSVTSPWQPWRMRSRRRDHAWTRSSATVSSGENRRKTWRWIRSVLAGETWRLDLFRSIAWFFGGLCWKSVYPGSWLNSVSKLLPPVLSPSTLKDYRSKVWGVGGGSVWVFSGSSWRCFVTQRGEVVP